MLLLFPNFSINGFSFDLLYFSYRVFVGEIDHRVIHRAEEIVTEDQIKLALNIWILEDHIQDDVSEYDGND